MRSVNQSKGCSGQQGFTLDQESMQLQEKERKYNQAGEKKDQVSVLLYGKKGNFPVVSFCREFP